MTNFHLLILLVAWLLAGVCSKWILNCKCGAKFDLLSCVILGPIGLYTSIRLWRQLTTLKTAISEIEAELEKAYDAGVNK